MDSQPSLFDDASFPPEPTAWEKAAEADRWAASLVFNLPVTTRFDYVVPDPFRDLLRPGQRVLAPFGTRNKSIVGYCVAVGPAGPTNRRLKSIESLLDREPLLTPRMLELTEWIANRYLCGWGQVLESVIPAGVRKGSGTRTVNLFHATADVAERLQSARLPPKQKAVLEVLMKSARPLRGEELAEAAQCGTGPIETLRKRGWIETVRERVDTFEPEESENVRVEDLKLNSDQRLALNTIQNLLREQRHRTVLLHGVTGSGKTEVYIQAIREVVSYGRQAIVLVPEISLTPQTIRRFRSRFESVAVLHSHLTDSERHWQWQKIAEGDVQVVVGARSAIFAPTAHLGLIIIDEEHETSFKQETTPRYHAREVARRRAELESIPLILGSATPTLESWRRVQTGDDLLIDMPRRVEGLPLPPVVIVDVRNDPHCSRGSAIGRAMENAIRTTLNDDGQIILFLNLRGFSPVLLCRSCGEAIRCPHCDITLTWHKSGDHVLCHSCDYTAKLPEECPSCQRRGIVHLGVGTQRLEQEVRTKFPGVSLLRMDSDSMKQRGSHDVALEAFRRGEVRVLLGTQMIAKGLDFPNVTLVGVINADTLLHQPDLRASERTFQLISQVAGRTGRSHRGGRVLVQTSCPADPAILKASEHDFHGFVEHEMKHRRAMNAPPFHQYLRVILRGEKESEVQEVAVEMARLLRVRQEEMNLPVRLLGPAPAPISRLKNYYRFHMQLAAEQLESIRELWLKTAADFPAWSHVEYVVDVDPMNMR